MSKALIKISLHCEKILEGKENEINITTESTHVMILRIYKLIQYNVEEDMNGTDGNCFFEKKRATLLLRESRSVHKYGI